MSIKDFFLTDYETHDNHSNEKLRTRYYRNRYSEAKDVVMRLIKELKGANVYVNDEYQEISFQTSSYFCVISLINTKPTETAIDIKLSYGSLSFGRGIKLIAEMYKFLDRNLELKGTSLYK